MTDIQKKLLEYLKSRGDFYRTSRTVFMAPAERAEKVKFYEDATKEVERLIEKVNHCQCPDWHPEF